MVRLTEDEIRWLAEHCPSLKYDSERSIISGPFTINHRSLDKPAIKACFEIEVPLCLMKTRNEYPRVKDRAGKIAGIARRKKLPLCDLHLYPDMTLCLGIPERFREYYPNGFTIEKFIEHLNSHLYWVAYYDRYNEAPWAAEGHGDIARLEYYLETKDVDVLRELHKKILGKGIAKSKLKNILLSPSLFLSLKRKLIGQWTNRQ